MGNKIAKKYLHLIISFTDGAKTASEFESEYLAEFKQEDDEMPEKIFEPLNSLFFAADAYCEDPELRDQHDIGDEEFLEEAVSAQRKLEQLIEDDDTN